MASFNKRQGEGPEFQKNLKLNVKLSHIITFLLIPRYSWKHTVSLAFFCENAIFHFTYLLKTHNSTSSLNTLHSAESAQFYSALLLTISLTPRCCQKHEA
jgi:hypothetical protein